MQAHNILLLGATGQLGHLLNTKLLMLGQVRTPSRQEADMCRPDNLLQSLKKITNFYVPTVIVNASAYTAVDKAETETEQAIAINATSVGVLAEFAQSVGAVLVHYSTDYVFDGSGSRAWQESDEPSPLSVYGRSKYFGEQAVRKSCTKHFIFRTSWVVGSHGGNFLKTMLKLASERDSLRVVSDQMGSPTSAELLAEVTVSLLKVMQEASSNDVRWGTYHVVPEGQTSWHKYAQYVVQGAWLRKAQLKATPESVLPILTADYPLPAPRPLNSRLCTEKLKNTFALQLPTWQQGVDEILDELIRE